MFVASIIIMQGLFGCTALLPKHESPVRLEIDQTTVFKKGSNSSYPQYVFCDAKKGPTKCSQPSKKISIHAISESKVDGGVSGDNGKFSHARTELGSVVFGFDSYELTKNAQAELLSIVLNLKFKKIDQPVHVLGFTDSYGSEGYNGILAKKRAEVVAGFLARAGFVVGEVGGVGSCCYLAGNETEKDRQVNRRAEIYIKKEGEIK